MRPIEGVIMAKRKTKQQKIYLQKLVDLGCIACYKEGMDTRPEIHHVRDYGYRDHSKAIPLCPAHHRPTAAVPGVPNIHGDKLWFEEKYGTEKELMALCRKLIDG